MSNLKLKMAYKNDLRLVLLNQFLPMLSKGSELCHLSTILSKSDKNGFFFPTTLRQSILEVLIMNCIGKNKRAHME